MYYAHLVTIKKIVESYQQQQPLSLFLKSFFRANKKYGSRDRKNITQHVFNYYRLGKALPDLDFYLRLQIATYLVDNMIIDEKLNAEKPLILADELEERITAVKNQFAGFSVDDIFPFEAELSKEINAIAFTKSLLSRPKVFIRIRKGFEKKVTAEFMELKFQYDVISANTFAFEPETKITETKCFEKGWFEIQDLSSQQTGNFFDAKPDEHWWDCCAGAGGKSLLFKEKFPETYLLVSDARGNILDNALARFKKTGVKKYKISNLEIGVFGNLGTREIRDSEIRELGDSGTGEFGNSEIRITNESTALNNDVKTPNSKPETLNPKHETSNSKTQTANQYDGIIVDAPCSGSGTWARTPENISFFKKEMIDEYQSKQSAIVENVMPLLKPGGQLIYITCSAFKKENEDVTQLLLKSGNLKLIKEQMFLGYENKADVMYAAHFLKR